MKAGYETDQTQHSVWVKVNSWDQKKIFKVAIEAVNRLQIAELTMWNNKSNGFAIITAIN